MTEQQTPQYFEIAVRHLERVQTAWDDPTDWSDLSIYGFYCLEAAVLSAASTIRASLPKDHRGKAELAQVLAADRGLPDVSELLAELNAARKAVAYGDVTAPELDPEDVARRIEDFVDAVRELVEAGGNV